VHRCNCPLKSELAVILDEPSKKCLELIVPEHDLDLPGIFCSGVRVVLKEQADTTDAELRLSIAMIEPVGGHGGAHYYDFGLARGLLAAGCRVSLYTCDETGDPRIPGLGFYPLYRGIYGSDSRFLRMIRFLRGSLSVFKNATAHHERICHYQVFNDLIPELVVITLAKLLRRKIVLTVHDVSSLAGPVTWKRRMTGWVYRSTDGIIAHNRVSARELESIGVPPKMIRVIVHGHYLDSARKMPPVAEARHELGIEPRARVILFFGQIKDVKGLDLLIEALPVVSREVRDVVLLIAGRPWKSDFARYDSLIETMGVRSQCILHIRFVPDSDVATYYAAADVVALPYRRIYQSGVLMMAMTYGRAVVVSDLPGMTEIVTDGMNGYVFPLGLKDSLAQTLVRALRNDQERAEIGLRALEYIRLKHDWNDIAAMTVQFFRGLHRDGETRHSAPHTEAG
jgi:D-inositol-3-phosphate glycosyltransferase